jgi:predicted membrane protein
MENNQLPQSTKKNWSAIIIIGLGIVFLLQTLHIMNLGGLISDWWPLLVIAAGVSKVQNEDKRNGTGVIIMGLIFLTATLDFINWGNIFRFWPLAIIWVGFTMLKNKNGNSFLSFFNERETTEDSVNISTIFGGIDRVVNSDNYTGSEVFVLFGGVNLDLRKAKAIESGCIINITALFGGVEIMVPQNWNVRVQATPIFGGVDDKSAVHGEKDVTVVLNGTVIFGAIEIKS